MADNTKIEWTDATWNPIRGCSRVSEGCRNCYAESLAGRFSGMGGAYEGLVTLSRNKSKRKWNGKIKFVAERLLDPLKWRKPRRIFVNSMSDLFHENVTDEMRDKIFGVMALCQEHTFQVLTKRPERMKAYLGYTELERRAREAMIGFQAGQMHLKRSGMPVLEWSGMPLTNVWLGVSVENQKAANERIPLLLNTPTTMRFLSVEPLLGPVDLREFLVIGPGGSVDGAYARREMLHWVIAGGESGPGARPMHPDWVRSLRDQCVSAGVPFFFKQWGEWAKYVHRNVEDADWRQDYARIKSSKSFCFLNSDGGCGFHGERLHVMQRLGKHVTGHLLDGKEWQQFPQVRA